MAPLNQCFGVFFTKITLWKRYINDIVVMLRGDWRKLSDFLKNYCNLLQNILLLLRKRMKLWEKQNNSAAEITI